MSEREWTTLGVVVLFFAVFLGMVLYAAQPQAATRIGPETHISMADLCPEGIN